MSRQHLATAYRGYHGLESQYYALRHLSNSTMTSAQHKNERLFNRHAEEMKHITEQEKTVRIKKERELQTMRDNFTTQLAYQYVYKNHSFKRFYKSHQIKKQRPVSDKPDMYEQERKKSAKECVLRPLGSLRQIEAYKDELKFPEIENHDSTNIPSPRVNMMGNKKYTGLQDDQEKDQIEKALMSFPNIQEAMAVEIKFKSKPVDDDKCSIITAPPAKLDAEENNNDPEIAKLKSLDMAQNLLLMKLRQQERYEAPRRLLPLTPATNDCHVTEKHKEAWRRILPETPSRPSTVFPGTTRTSMGVKKMLKKEATDLIENWSHSSRRHEFVENARERNQAELSEHPIPVINHERPFSAIIRDYKEYKRQRDEWNQCRKKENDNGSVIVRQMSPQPRVGSPTAQRQYDYINRILTPMRKKREDANSVVAKHAMVRRTDSEKLTSVSRTSSYKEIPEEELKKLQENALLTAAERIEIELQKRKQSRQCENDDNEDSHTKNHNQTMKLVAIRQLPPTPQKGAKVKPKRTFQTKTPSKTIKTPNIKPLVSSENGMDDSNIDKVGPLAIEKDKTEEREHNSYRPVIKQRGESGTGASSYSEENLQRMRHASILYDQEHWPKLKRRMTFSYEKFKRNVPDRKQQLKLMAKKKIQMNNAQIEAERTIQKGEIGQADRPQTRVSFNENVVVFKTI